MWQVVTATWEALLEQPAERCQELTQYACACLGFTEGVRAELTLQPAAPPCRLLAAARAEVHGSLVGPLRARHLLLASLRAALLACQKGRAAKQPKASQLAQALSQVSR